MNCCKDGLISVYCSWSISSQKQLSDIIITTQNNKPTDDDCSFDHDRCEAVCLDRAEEDCPCVITLMCTPDSPAVISSLQVLSEARTIEVYSLSGEYWGTCRGEEVQRSHSDGSEDKRSFYRNCVVLESPAASCEMKLLSLGGRSSVAIARLGVGLETLMDRQGGASVDPGIDLQRVRAMMEEMGTTLSPGAQNLMELVQCQQKNKSDMLGGFIPLLMGGGALSCLSRGGGASSSAGMESGQHQQNLSSSEHNQIPGVMSSLLSSNTDPISPELLPMLQSVCGQVTRLHLEEAMTPERKRNGERPTDEDANCSAVSFGSIRVFGGTQSNLNSSSEMDIVWPQFQVGRYFLKPRGCTGGQRRAASTRCKQSCWKRILEAFQREGHMCCGGFEQVLEKVVEKRMEEMERRLKEHLDMRLDALQQRLEITLQQALSQTPQHPH
ncbi:ATPase PAAT isoform X2 [Myxocyprinus asiaticus]|uniref:ATPase PAAT isoform X2 n=1 Tax=Myxocyprinus asiaticus TaxID=70543 RepID=UPI0022235DF5|nr:ATPase PAAT isoform X2 [Myxocyprinus asiaticus]